MICKEKQLQGKCCPDIECVSANPPVVVSPRRIDACKVCLYKVHFRHFIAWTFYSYKDTTCPEPPTDPFVTCEMNYVAGGCCPTYTCKPDEYQMSKECQVKLHDRKLLQYFYLFHWKRDNWSSAQQRQTILPWFVDPITYLAGVVRITLACLPIHRTLTFARLIHFSVAHCCWLITFVGISGSCLWIEWALRGTWTGELGR